MTLAVLSLDRATAGHLAIAIADHRRALRRAGEPCPTGLRQLEELARSAGAAANSGQTRTTPDNALESASEPGHARRNGTRLLSHRQAAQQLGVSERTIRRMLDRGELRHIVVAGRRRVQQATIDELRNPEGHEGGSADRGMQ